MFKSYLLCEDECVRFYGFSLLQENVRILMMTSGCIIIPNDVVLSKEDLQKQSIPLLLEDRETDNEEVYNYIKQYYNGRLDFVFDEDREVYIGI